MARPLFFGIINPDSVFLFANCLIGDTSQFLFVMNDKNSWNKFNLPIEARRILENAPSVTVFETVDQLVDAACGGPESDFTEVAYEIPGKGRIVEATVARVRNGVAANYPEPYMRRRDPDCMLIGDEQPTNKPTYRSRFGAEFDGLREETFSWMEQQPLAVFGFIAGKHGMGMDSLVIAPANAGFFAFGLSLLQGIVPLSELRDDFTPKSIIYVAPPFRHTHFEGRQVVVHNRHEHLHELFSYNLYPGPSAKKGIYGVLIGLGEKEGWVTAHCSTVRVVTPYDNEVTLMHEGASGGGKSEMLEQAHREPDGRLVLGKNLVTGESRYIEFARSCTLHPVTDDMALCHPSLQDKNGKMQLTDAEDAWFVRVNHIDDYGKDLQLEKLTALPRKPLLFLNIDAVPNSRALIWEHIEDKPGSPCPNPRVIIPRDNIPDIIEGSVQVDIRSYGVRTPPCTKEVPSYGIMGIFHVLPPALAWLWRLAAPRGHANPSIVDSEGMSSEGVGSYWPFATGRKVDQANLLLQQFERHRETQYILVPNQNVGAWEVGFMPQWIAREYLTRRGGRPFRSDQIQPSRCALLGYSLYQLHVEGHMITSWFLQVDTQPEVGQEAYDKGAAILTEFFHECLADFHRDPDLSPVGKRIIECCLDNGAVDDYEQILSR